MDDLFQRRWHDLHHRQVSLRDAEHFRTRKEEEVHLDNAAALWRRHVATTQREVSDKAEGLKTVSHLAALLASLALVAFLQFTYTNYDAQQRWYSPAVEPLYATAMAATVMLAMSSVVLCNLILASVLRTGTGYVGTQAEADFMQRADAYAHMHSPGTPPPAVLNTFGHHWRQRCEGDWQLAFRLFAAGIPAFFSTMILSSWIKFANDGLSALLATLGMLAGLISCGVLYWRWSRHLLDSDTVSSDEAALRLQLVPPSGLPFDWTLPPERAMRQCDPPAPRVDVVLRRRSEPPPESEGLLPLAVPPVTCV